MTNKITQTSRMFSAIQKETMYLRNSVYVQGSFGHESRLQDGHLVRVQKSQVQTVGRVVKQTGAFPVAVGDRITDKHVTHTDKIICLDQKTNKQQTNNNSYLNDRLTGALEGKFNWTRAEL